MKDLQDGINPGASLQPPCSLLSRKEAADYLGISPRTFDRIQEGRVIPFVLVGERRRYLLSDLGSYIKSRRSI